MGREINVEANEEERQMIKREEGKKEKEKRKKVKEKRDEK